MKVLLSLIATASIGGLILAKSRGPWITALFGILLIVLLSAPGKRKRLAATVVAGVAGLGLVGVLVLGDELFLIGLGLLQRFASLSTAATSDISLINRYAESAAVWSAIKANPFIGYGWGAPVVRYDLITQFTYQTGFVHNGYLWLWHKVGVWGLAIFLAGYVGVLWQGVMGALARHEGASLAAGAVGALAAYAVLAFPSNPFAVMDQMLVVALMLALASGVYERQRAATQS